jgi:hypothetical protein
MKTRGIGSVGPPFLTSALDEGEWSASHPSRFTSEEIPPPPSIPFYRMLGWPQSRSKHCENRKICPCWKSNPGHPARSPPLYRLSYPDILGVVYESCGSLGHGKTLSPLDTWKLSRNESNFISYSQEITENAGTRVGLCPLNSYPYLDQVETDSNILLILEVDRLFNTYLNIL